MKQRSNPLVLLNLLMIALSAFMLGGCFATRGPAIDRARATRPALLVLDMQRDFLAHDGRLRIAQEQVVPVLDATNRLIQQARSADIDVIYVRNAFARSDYVGNWFRSGAAIEGSRGAELDPRLSVAGPVFNKDAPDAFSSAAFDARLRERRIGHLYVTGVFADQCVYWTTRGAINRKYKVTAIPEGLGAASAEDRSEALVKLRQAGAEVLAAGVYRRLFIVSTASAAKTHPALR